MPYCATYLVNTTRHEYHIIPQYPISPLSKTLLYLEAHYSWDIGKDDIYLQSINDAIKKEYEADNYKPLKGVPKFWI